MCCVDYQTAHCNAVLDKSLIYTPVKVTLLFNTFQYFQYFHNFEVQLHTSYTRLPNVGDYKKKKITLLTFNWPLLLARYSAKKLKVNNVNLLFSCNLHIKIRS